MDSRAVNVDNQDNNGDNDPVATHPLEVASHEATGQAASDGNESNAPVATPSLVIRQAGLGRLICEECGADVPRITANQRFCCTPHRIANWERMHGRRVSAAL